MTPYNQICNSICWSYVPATLPEGLLPLLQKKALVDVGYPRKSTESEDPTEFKCSANTDDMLRYMTYIMFDRVCPTSMSGNLYFKKQKFSELLRYASNGSQI